MKRDTGFVVMVLVIVVIVALLAASVGNEGCLPWQDRVGVKGSYRCEGSWFPFASSATPFPR